MGSLFNVIAVGELFCWGICFWWMHRISSRQDAVLKQLQQQGRRIERISREEHRILQDLHPKVQSIEKNIGES